MAGKSDALSGEITFKFMPPDFHCVTNDNVIPNCFLIRKCCTVTLTHIRTKGGKTENESQEINNTS